MLDEPKKHRITRKDDAEFLLRRLFEQKGSDMHIITGQRPVFRISGQLVEQTDWAVMYESDTELLVSLLSDEATKIAVLSGEDIDIAYKPRLDTDNSHPAKYRLNFCKELNGFRIVARRITSVPPALSDLNLPPAFIEACRTIRQGMILITGPTGSGKSSSFAAIIGDLKENSKNEHIITIEDPVEYEYTNIKAKHGSIVTQREKSVHFTDFNRAMKSVLRQDPDIIMIGELRDRETIDLAIEAADTGHLVLATVHSNNVPSTLSRMLSNYPADEQPVIRTRLVSLMSAVMTQRLEQRKDKKGRIALHEYLIFTPELKRELAAASDTEGTQIIKRALDAKNQNMIDSALYSFKKGNISDDVYNKIAESLQLDTRVMEHKQAVPTKSAKQQTAPKTAKQEYDNIDVTLANESRFIDQYNSMNKTAKKPTDNGA